MIFVSYKNINAQKLISFGEDGKYAHIVNTDRHRRKLIKVANETLSLLHLKLTKSVDFF